MPAGQPWQALDWHPPHSAPPPPPPGTRETVADDNEMPVASHLHLRSARLYLQGDDQEMNNPEVTVGPTSLPRIGRP